MDTRTIIWAVLGVILLSAEVMSGTLVLLFFGVAAFIVAVAKLAGLDVLWIELLVFAVAGGSSLLLFRSKLREALAHRSAGYRGDRHETITLTTAIAAGGEGRVEYQGTTWTAVNEGGRALDAGERVMIVRTEGVKLFVVSKA
jgi:membrane protein implicated in regulation of membrane protease activity